MNIIKIGKENARFQILFTQGLSLRNHKLELDGEHQLEDIATVRRFLEGRVL